MKHNRIIVNSKYLHGVLFELITPLIPQEDNFKIGLKCKDGILSFRELDKTIFVESDDWETTVTIDSLRRLFNVLGKIREQPLTISFDNKFHSWVEIFNVLV